jgi:hypothetical protein
MALVTISKTHVHKIRMGAYETFEVGTTITLTDVEDTDEALDAIDALISDALDDDIKQAQELAVDDSYIKDWGTK